MREALKTSVSKYGPKTDSSITVENVAGKGLQLVVMYAGKKHYLPLSSVPLSPDEHANHKNHQKIKVDHNGKLGLGESAPEGLLTINQGADDDIIFSCKSSDISHSWTDIAEADTFFRIKKANATSGGVILGSFAETGVDYSLIYAAYVTDEDNTRSTSGGGPFDIRCGKPDSATAGAMSADKNMMVIRNFQNTRFIFDSDGDAHADGSAGFTVYSDSRLKTDIETIPYGLAEVLQFQPKKFKKASGSFDESGNVVLEDNARVSIGFIAQDIKSIIPEIVKDIDESKSFYSMNDGQMMSIIVKAIQELSAKVTALEN